MKKTKRAVLSLILSISICMSPAIGIKFLNVSAAEATEYTFNGEMTQPVLDSYLSKAVTLTSLVNHYPDVAKRNELLRFLSNTGTKYIQRAACTWTDYASLDTMMANTEGMANVIHNQDTEVILEGVCFETISTAVNNIAVPSWVFTEFGQTSQSRNFNYSAMLYSDGRYVDHWGTGQSVPDITKLETQMFIYYMSRRFIDAGVEALHYGQTQLTGEEDPFYCNWNSTIRRVRNYASTNARRNNVLINAHNQGMYNNCTDKWYSAKGKFIYESGNASDYYNSDITRLNRSGTQSQDGYYIIYNLDNISGFEILTANSSVNGDIPNAYDIYVSSNCVDWTHVNYTSTEIYRSNNSMPNYRMVNSGSIQSNMYYFKISWKELSSINLAHLLNVSINGSSGNINDTLEEPNPMVKKLSLDFIAYPARPKAVPGKPYTTVFEVGFIDSLYNKSIGGLNPQGFISENSPYLVELDNCGGNNGYPGQNTSDFWPWGYDEISWFANQSSSYRSSWLNYAVDWIEANDSAGHFAMPGIRAYINTYGQWGEYQAINASSAFPFAHSDENAIKSIFERTGPAVSNRVKNSCFENGSNSWMLQTHFSVSPEEKRSGNYSLKVTGTSDNCNAYQSVSVNPNTNYILSFYGKCNASSTYKVLSGDWQTNITGDLSVTPNNKWTKYSVTFNSGNNTTVVIDIVHCGATNYTSYYDDFSLLPEDNLVLNSSLENGVVPWCLSPNFSLSTEQSRTGSFSLKITGSMQNGTGLQFISVEPNTNYTFSIYGKCSHTSQIKIFDSHFTENLSDDILTSANNVWTKYDVTFNSRGNKIIALVLNDTGVGNSTSYFDDISFVKNLNNPQLTNGSFEDVYSPWIIGSHFNITDEQSNSGVKSLKVSGTSDNCTSYQEVTVQINTNYTLSFYGKCNASSTYKIFSSDWNTNITGDLTTTANDTWTEYKATFNSGSNTTVIIAIYHSGATSYTSYYDDFSIRQDINCMKNYGLENAGSKWVLETHFSISSEQKKTGLYSLKVSGISDNCNAYQFVSVQANTNYTFSFYGKCNASSTYKVLSGDWNINITGDLAVSNNNMWTKYSVDFNSGNNTTIAIVIVHCGSVSYTSYYDEFSIERKYNNNLATNGSLESDGRNWTLETHFSISTEQSYTGTKSLKATGTSDNCNAYQIITVEPNTDYVLSFFGKCAAPSNYKVLSGDWSSNITGDLAVTANNTWTKYTVMFNSGNNSTISIAIVHNGAPSYTSYYDDFSVDKYIGNNLVKNSSFDEGNGYWNLDSHFNISIDQSKTGIKSLKVSGARDNCNAYQFIKVKPNTNCVLTFYGKCNAASNYKVLNQDWSSNITGDMSTIANNIWTQYKINFNSGNNSIICIVIVHNGAPSYTSYYDDFQIIQE